MLAVNWEKPRKDEKAYCLDLDFRPNSKNPFEIFAGFKNKLVKSYKFNPQTNEMAFNYEFIGHMDPIKGLTYDG